MRAIVIIIVLLNAAFAHAQKLKEIEVPPVVINAFKAKFKNVDKVEWELENKIHYEAEFKLDGQELEARFDRDGNWVETETEMKVSELPEAVTNAIKQKYEGYKIEEAGKVNRFDNERYYSVEIEKGDESFDVKITADGKVLGELGRNDDEDEKD